MASPRRLLVSLLPNGCGTHLSLIYIAYYLALPLVRDLEDHTVRWPLFSMYICTFYALCLFLCLQSLAPPLLLSTQSCLCDRLISRRHVATQRDPPLWSWNGRVSLVPHLLAVHLCGTRSALPSQMVLTHLEPIRNRLRPDSAFHPV